MTENNVKEGVYDDDDLMIILLDLWYRDRSYNRHSLFV